MSTGKAGPSGRIEADLEQPIQAVTRTHRGVFAGAPLGVVAVLVLASVAFGATVVKVAIAPAAEPTAALVTGADPTEEAPASLEPTPTSSPSILPTATRTTRPASAVPTIVATPAVEVADLGALGVADNLDLSVSFSWHPYAGPNLTAYALVYENTSSGRSPSYPGSPAWGTARSDATAVTLPTVAAGDYQVRVQALCGNSNPLVVCGQTGVVHVHLSAGRGATAAPTAVPTPRRTAPPATQAPPATPAPPAPTAPADGSLVDLGALTVADNLNRTISFSWHGYTGPGLTTYAVFAEDYASGASPTYPVSTAWATTASTKTTVSVTPPGPGTFNVRVQALCGSGAVLHVCGQTTIARIHLSQAVYGSPTPAVTPTPAATPPSTPAPTATAA